MPSLPIKIYILNCYLEKSNACDEFKKKKYILFLICFFCLFFLFQMSVSNALKTNPPAHPFQFIVWKDVLNPFSLFCKQFESRGARIFSELSFHTVHNLVWWYTGYIFSFLEQQYLFISSWINDFNPIKIRFVILFENSYVWFLFCLSLEVFT